MFTTVGIVPVDELANFTVPLVLVATKTIGAARRMVVTLAGILCMLAALNGFILISGYLARAAALNSFSHTDLVCFPAKVTLLAKPFMQELLSLLWSFYCRREKFSWMSLPS